MKLPDETVEYYDLHADEFVERTSGLDMEELYRPFLERLSPGARILDAGCGSGRDARAFNNMGYDTVAIDASPEMVERARRLCDAPVHTMRFEEIPYENEFDGVWACASLLHVPTKRLVPVLGRLTRALTVEGVFYVSFKLGNGVRRQGKRLFTDLDEKAFRALVVRVSMLEILDIWRTQDMRPETEQQWLNALLRRVT